MIGAHGVVEACPDAFGQEQKHKHRGRPRLCKKKGTYFRGEGKASPFVLT